MLPLSPVPSPFLPWELCIRPWCVINTGSLAVSGDSHVLIQWVSPTGCHFASSSLKHLGLQRSPDVFSHGRSHPNDCWRIQPAGCKTLKRFFFLRGSSGKDYWENDTRGSSLAPGVESQQLLCFLLCYLGELSAQTFPQESLPLRGGGSWILIGTETLFHCDTNPSTQSVLHCICKTRWVPRGF